MNEDINGDAAVLRCENKRLKQELALAHQLVQHSAAQSGGHAVSAAAELQEQQAQLQQALTMLAELGDRNSQLEDALEYSKRYTATMSNEFEGQPRRLASDHISGNTLLCPESL